jgi:hypothetical protein
LPIIASNGDEHRHHAASDGFPQRDSSKRKLAQAINDKLDSQRAGHTEQSIRDVRAVTR